ncbi:MAG TPA: hypothetical protein VGR26_19155 [Acidimicrobiales bacterium]|nr:hypothetical protein [Acidimicrobiales bacterium]
MHRELVTAETDLGVQLLELSAASDRTEQRISDVRRSVARSLYESMGDAAVASSELDILAFGSIARHEMAPGSDFDYLVVAHQLGPDPATIHHYRRAANTALAELDAEPPGSSGLFGAVVPSASFVTTIGLNEDTNLNLSRRILLLEESLPLTEPNRHRVLVTSILNRYLYDYRSRSGPLVPRFLLNDVVRFWRTVAVDYQAKRWEEMEGEKWGLRYIKLRSSRKLTYASTLASLFMPVIAQIDTTANYLSELFRIPALGRLAQLGTYTGAKTSGALREVLALADRFVGWLADEEFRKEVSAVQDPLSSPPGSVFCTARDATVDLQRALESLFFSDEPLRERDFSLGSLSRKYLGF